MNAEELDPLPTVLPPEGVAACKMRDVAVAMRALDRGRIDVAGARGCASPALVAAAARVGRRVVFVVEDLDAARRAAGDVALFLGSGREDAEDTGEGDVLVLATSESSPFADISPDRRAAMSRLATLSHLAQRRPWRVLVVPAGALVRKVVPRADLAKRAMRLVAETEIDRESLLRQLTDAGYVRVPVVEDPGTLAVRGALLDIWPPSSDAPVRVELYGDLVLSLRSFDPAEQKTSKNASDQPYIWLPPVREATVDPASVDRAKARVIELAEAMDYPTTKTRALVEDIVAGRSFFGAEAYLPAYYERLDPLFEYVEESALFLIEDPPTVTRALREELERAVREGELKARSQPSFAVEALYLDEQEVLRAMRARPVVPLHRSPVLGAASDDGLGVFESLEPTAPGTPTLDLGSSDQLDLTRAVKAARASKGKNAGLGPLVRRLRHWRDHGMQIVVTARAHTQAERLATLLRHQGVACKTRSSPFDPAWLEGTASRSSSGR
jgi:transcription-repair coupling factor (superfamily II helicase)